MRTLEAAPKTSKVQMLGRILLGLMLVYTGVSHLTFARQEFQAQVPATFRAYFDAFNLDNAASSFWTHTFAFSELSHSAARTRSTRAPS